ncbi:hypothetical protein F5X97DRAFT_300644, partial [Nemania serpens]
MGGSSRASHRQRQHSWAERSPVVCADSLEAWHCPSEEHYWPCGVENLFFVNPDDGSMMRSIEVDVMFDEMQAEEAREQQGLD